MDKTNIKRKEVELKIGQEVYVKPAKVYPKTKEKYWGPYKIHRILPNGTVEVKHKHNKILKYHINSLKMGPVSDFSSSEED